MTKGCLSNSPIMPVEKTIHVNLNLEEAFRLFTEGIGSWWPLDAKHSLNESEVKSCAFECKEGGRIYEIHKDGSQFTWGTVHVFNSPNFFLTTWHPGNPEKLATQLEVHFSLTEEGTTVKLTHYGWEARGDKGQEYRDDYNSGWDFVLGKYINTANSHSG